jgi:hypothetical protein
MQLPRASGRATGPGPDLPGVQGPVGRRETAMTGGRWAVSPTDHDAVPARGRPASTPASLGPINRPDPVSFQAAQGGEVIVRLESASTPLRDEPRQLRDSVGSVVALRLIIGRSNLKNQQNHHLR